jgi:hypothetical protein
MLHVYFWSFYPHMNTISARYIYLHLLLGWFLIEAYHILAVPSGTPLYSLGCLYTFSLIKGDPPTSYVYVRVITPLSLHRYPYIDHYKFSAILMLAHKQINENMVTGHQKFVGKNVNIITVCISCNLNNINHEHGKCIAQHVHLGHWKN